ncbi:helix-turn-helix domain-containing protein [Terribacillus saccharophilus]|uniref:helix-turn-helix domain-containing protein n=1 Tax=Terribacillus saccharophilus TaxID=361277 RepID=UPI0013DDC3DB
MEIGPLIKLHRIKQSMTQEDLAAGIVSESYLSKIENQKTRKPMPAQKSSHYYVNDSESSLTRRTRI